MRRLFVCLATVVAMAFATSTSDAGVLSSVSSANNSIAKVTSIGAVLTTPGSINTGTVTIDLEVYKLNVPVQLDFVYSAGGADTLTDYTITLNVKNLLAVPEQTLNFQGFDLVRNVNAGGAVVSSGIRPNIAPTSDTFWVENPGSFNITNGFRWGGLSGGGARLAPGGTAINTFVYRVTFDGTTGAGTSALTFTANPEPTTLLLGSLVMGPAAYALRRRRKQIEEVPAV